MVESCKLVANDTLERRTQETSHSVALTYTPNEEVHVVYIFVDHLQTLHNFVRDVVDHVVKVRDPAEPAKLAETVVAWKAVVSPALDVQGSQVHAKALVPALEEMVGQLVGHDVVKVLAGLAGQAHQESVEASRSVDKLGVEELLRKWHSSYSPSLDRGLLYKAGICENKRVPVKYVYF